MSNNDARRYLGTEPIRHLMARFAIPSIVAMLVSSLYNMVDQIFIGQAVGVLGNSATNIAFPLSMCCTAFGLLFGIGGAANFNLNMGRGNYDQAPYYLCSAATMNFLSGTILMLIAETLLYPMLRFFGSPADVLPYAAEYTRITALGFPFLVLTIGGGHLLRADGSPNMTMITGLSGAIINTVLDALFVLVFHWGMTGAAIATVIGQVISAALVINYLRHPKSFTSRKEYFLPEPDLVLKCASLGVASCINQIGMMVVQIVLNNVLRKYGGMSVYGEAIPIACAGIAMKCNQLLFSIVIGFAQGSQPIESFNYGAKQYDRVKTTYLFTLMCASTASIVSFILFQLIPNQLLSLFGTGSTEYFSFGAKFFRIYLFCTWANCIQPCTSQFFAACGKPQKGAFVSLTRQVLFLLPLLLILPRLFGIDGVFFAGPISDGFAAIIAAVMVFYEFKNMTALEVRNI